MKHPMVLIAGGALALVAAIPLVWMIGPGGATRHNEDSAVEEKAVNRQRLAEATFSAAPSETRSAVQASGSIPAPPPPSDLPDFKRIGKAKNFRAFMHETLIQPNPEKVALAVRMTGLCSAVEVQNITNNPKFKVPIHLADAWRQRVDSCTSSGGIDKQQRAALRALVKGAYPSLYATYFERIFGNAAEQEAIDSQFDPRFVVSWGSVAISDNRPLLAGDESILRDLPEMILNPAWHAAVCSISDCDDHDYRIAACSELGLCENIPITKLVFEVVRRDFKITEDQWQDIVAASKRRAVSLFPHALGSSPSRRS